MHLQKHSNDLTNKMTTTKLNKSNDSLLPDELKLTDVTFTYTRGYTLTIHYC